LRTAALPPIRTIGIALVLWTKIVGTRRDGAQDDAEQQCQSNKMAHGNNLVSNDEVTSVTMRCRGRPKYEWVHMRSQRRFLLRRPRRQRAGVLRASRPCELLSRRARQHRFTPGGQGASLRAAPHICYNILKEFTASLAAPWRNVRTSSPAVNLGATTAPPADPPLRESSSLASLGATIPQAVHYL
jgi:hypothetical protein